MAAGTGCHGRRSRDARPLSAGYCHLLKRRRSLSGSGEATRRPRELRVVPLVRPGSYLVCPEVVSVCDNLVDWEKRSWETIGLLDHLRMRSVDTIDALECLRVRRGDLENEMAVYNMLENLMIFRINTF